MKENKNCRCNFCGTSSLLVKKMIGTPTGDSYICESCAQLCCDIFQGKITPDDALKVTNCKRKVILKEFEDKIKNEVSIQCNKFHEVFYRITKTMDDEIVKILNRAKNNLKKTETFGKLEEDIDIAISMLTSEIKA